MRRLHSRFPPEKWTSLSSVSGPTGTRRRRSSSCSSASSSRTQEAGARCRGPLHRPWCLHLQTQCLQGQTLQCPHLPRVPSPLSSTTFRHFFSGKQNISKVNIGSRISWSFKIEATSLEIVTQQVR